MSEKPRSRIVLIAASLVVAGVVAVVLYSRHSGAAESGVQFTSTTVRRGDIVQTVTATGQLAPLISVEVSSQISGLVTEVNVDFNSVVTRGQVLARIDPSTYQQRLLQAEADLEAAKASHKLAMINARRLKELRDEDLVPQQDFDTTEALLHQSKANLLTRRATVANARLDLERCTIVSPIDGVVIFKQTEVGRTVVSSFSAPTLFTIARDLSRMRIIAAISEVDVGRVEVGQRAMFTIDAIPARTFEGRVVQIRSPYTPSDKQPASQIQTSDIPTFDAVIEVDNRELLLRPSLTANISIVVGQKQNVLRVPNGALRVVIAESSAPSTSEPVTSDARSGTVYRLRADARVSAPEPVAVLLGMSDGGATEVLEGLQEGERVVTGTVSAMTAPARRSFLF